MIVFNIIMNFVLQIVHKKLIALKENITFLGLRQIINLRFILIKDKTNDKLMAIHNHQIK